MRLGFLSVMALLLTASTASAQFDSATVVGTVRDASGGVVPGATVTLTGVETGISATRTSNDNGNFEFPAVRPGIYVVTAEKTGFALALVDNVQVQVGARLRVDLQMPVGQVSEKVEVTASSPLIETDSSQRGQVITGDQTRALPLTGARVLGAGAAHDRRQAGRLVADDRQHAARGRAQRQRPAQHVQQLPDRRRRQQRLRHQQPGLLQPGDAAGARRDRRVQGRHQQHERGVRPRRRRHDQRQLSQRHQRVPRQRLGVPPRHAHERHRLLQADHRQAAARSHTSSAASLGGPIVQNRRSSSPTTKGCGRRARSPASRPSRRRRSGRASSPSTSAIRAPAPSYPAGTPIPMTAFAREVLSALPDTNVPGNTNNYTHAAGVHRRLEQGRRQDRPAGDADAVDVRPLRVPQPRRPTTSRTSRCRRAAPATATSTRATGSSCSARRGCPTRRRCSKCGSATRGRRRARTRRRSARPARSTQFGLPGLPDDARIAGGLPTQVITGYSDLGRQATNPQWQYPTVYNPKINYTWTMERALVQERLRVPADRHRGAGRQPALRPRHLQRTVHASGRRGGEQPLQPRRLHARPARAVRAQQRARRRPAPQHALRLPAGRLARRAAS